MEKNIIPRVELNHNIPGQFLHSDLCSFQFRIFTAPFQHVGFADFWLADQLNSLAVALLDLQFIICFYAHDWHVSNGECFLICHLCDWPLIGSVVRNIIVFFGRIFSVLEVDGRRGGLMVSAPDSRSSGQGSSPGQGHCVVFFGRKLSNNNNNHNNLIIYIALFTCADQKRFTVISLKTIKSIHIHKTTKT